ncbi:hypothetical protein Tco_1205690 [Tanacetum coccineum]
MVFPLYLMLNFLSVEKRKDKGKAIMKDDEYINKEERQRIAKDAEIAKQLQEEIDIARYHAQQNKSFSKAKVRKNMCMYLKNQGRYKQNSEIKKEVMKRSGFDFQKPPAKRQKIGEVSESVEEQSAGKEKEVKYPIIDWEVFTEESRSYWRIIRVGNHTEVYQVFEDMLKRFARDDLEKLWDLVKKKFSSTEPTIDKEKVLWVELKRLFELDDDDILWKLQRYMHDPLKWKLYDTCGVHHVSTEIGHDIDNDKFNPLLYIKYI